MKTLINIPDEQTDILNQICKEQGVSRAKFIRQAITLLIEKQRKTLKDDKAFGILRNKKIDGLKYQEKLRAEWDDEGTF